MNKTDWKHTAELIRASMSEEQPPVKIEKVMEVLGYSSKSSAEYALIKLQEMGVVKWIKGKWYLV
jgi:Mn-dependent DtxR family transcriptional regulator